MNLLHKLEQHAGHLWEHCFWNANSEGRLVQSGEGPEVTNPTPYTWLMTCDQNFLEGYCNEDILSRGYSVDRPYRIAEIYYDEADKDYPVRLKAQNEDSHVTQTYRCKYVLGCDGANSTVGRILGLEPETNSTPEVWIVIDCEYETDFPDIRKRCPVRSSKGALHLIPTAGGKPYCVLTKIHPESSSHWYPFIPLVICIGVLDPTRTPLGPMISAPSMQS